MEELQRTPQRDSRKNLQGLGGICQLRFQQEPLNLLRLHRLSDSLPESSLSCRIYGRRAL